MYIQINNNFNKPALLSRKLYKRMGKPDFIHLSRIKGTDEFIMVPMSERQSKNIVCSPVMRSKSERRTPASFYWTVPSLEYFKTVTGINIVNSKIIKIHELKINDKTYFKLCTD